MQQPTDTNLDNGRSRWHIFMLCSSLAGVMLFAVVSFAYGSVSPEYDIFRDDFGYLELLKHGWIQSVNLAVLGLFMIAFAAGLRQELAGGQGSVFLPLFQLTAGAGLVLTGIFAKGPVHKLSTAIVFLSLITGLFVFARHFAGKRQWKGWSAYTIITAIVMAILIAVFVYAKNSGVKYIGIWSRSGMIVWVLWTFFFTLRLLTGRRLGSIDYEN